MIPYRKFLPIVNKLTEKKTQTRIAVCVFFILITLFSFGQVSYNDFFWHLALGKWMLATSSFLTHDIFSIAFQGKLWLNNTWIFDTLTYLIHQYSGYIGLGALRFVVFTATYIFLIKIARMQKKTSLLFVISIFFLTIPLIRNFLRPEITGPLFVAIFLFALFKYKYSRSKLIFLLPLIEIIWVNTHGSFELGPILVGIFFTSELIRNVIRHRNNILQAFFAHKRIKIYFFILIAVFLASFINPYGYSIYPIVSKILADQESLKNIGEWRSLPLSYFLQFQFNDSLPLIVLAWSAAITILYKAKKLLVQQKKVILFLERFSYEEALLFVSFLASTLQYIRGMPMFGLIAAIIISKNNYLFIQEKRATILHSLLLLFTVGIAHISMSNNLMLNTGPSEFIQPREAFDFILQEKIPANILDEYAGGSELIWYLYPDYKVFMDGRAANLYDASFYWYYRNLDNETIYSKITTQYNLQSLVGPHSWDLAKKISNMKDWSLVFFDNFASVYVKNDAATELSKMKKYTTLTPLLDLKKIKDFCNDTEKKSILLQEIKRNVSELKHPLFSYLVLAQLAIDCHEETESLLHAEKLMKIAVTVQPNNTSYYHNLGVIELKLKKDKEALKNFKKSFRFGKNAENMTGYAIALHNLGKYNSAEKAFKKVFELPGDTPKEFYQVYGRVSYQLDHNAQAIDFFRRYMDLLEEKDITSQDYRDLANAYKDNNDLVRAQEYFKKADDLEMSTKNNDNEI